MPERIHHANRVLSYACCSSYPHNPDFAALAVAYGALGVTVKDAGDFPAALAAARAHAGPALIHLITDVEAITPTTTLTALREGG